MADEPTNDPARGTSPRHAAAWRAHAAALAAWTDRHLVNRRDAYVTQQVGTDGVIRRTARKDGLTIDRLTRHYAAGPDAPPDRILAIYAASEAATSRFGGIDIDAHGDEDPEANLRLALRLQQRAAELGLAVVLLDSSGGRGGYHLWLPLEAGLPMGQVRRLLRWLVRDHAECGVSRCPDLRPDAFRLGPKGYSSALRLAGRHHQRPEWSRAWSPTRGRWLEGDAAIAALLELRGVPIYRALIVPEDFDPRPAPPTPRQLVVPWADDPEFEHERDVALARDAIAYLDPYMHHDDWVKVMAAVRGLGHDGAALFDEWSQEAPFEYDSRVVDYKWGTFRPGREGDPHLANPGTLLFLAEQAGWPGPIGGPLAVAPGLADRPGPLFVVPGAAAFRALERAGRAVVGLPEDRPALRPVARVVAAAGPDRGVVVIDSKRPPFDAAAAARVLGRLTGREVLYQPIAPFEAPEDWIADRLARDEGEES